MAASPPVKRPYRVSRTHERVRSSAPAVAPSVAVPDTLKAKVAAASLPVKSAECCKFVSESACHASSRY
jgi:hypothetical protein